MPDYRNGKRISMAEAAYQKIKTMVLKNQIPRGKFISLNELQTQQSGIGRTPLREAAQRLNEERLLTVVPRKGIIVPEFNLKHIMDLQEMRHLLERFAYVKAADNLDDKGLKRIEGIVRAMDNPMGKSSYESARQNSEFHLALAEYCNNKVLLETLSGIYDHSISVYTFFLVDPDRYRNTQDEHWEIFQAVKEKKKNEIARAVERHYKNTQQILIESIINK